MNFIKNFVILLVSLGLSIPIGLIIIEIFVAKDILYMRTNTPLAIVIFCITTFFIFRIIKRVSVNKKKYINNEFETVNETKEKLISYLSWFVYLILTVSATFVVLIISVAGGFDPHIGFGEWLLVSLPGIVFVLFLIKKKIGLKRNINNKNISKYPILVLLVIVCTAIISIIGYKLFIF